MSKIRNLLLTAAAAMMLSSLAQAGVSLNATRVGAKDVAAVEKFYQAAFGLQEVNRFSFPGGAEVLLNFGDTVAAAKANTGAEIVIMQRASDDVKDPIPHIIFSVTDIAATVAAVKAAGGTMNGEPREFGKTGIMIGMGTDPAGNQLEFIQQPKH